MNLELANQQLKDLNSTCIILKNNEIIYKSNFIGVKPLIMFLNEHAELQRNDELLLIDKIIGKAALLLAVKCGIKTILTPVISQEALDAIEHYGVEWEAGKIVPYIINREGNGKCPIEASVTDTIDLDEAYRNIKSVIAELMKKQSDS